MSQGSFRLGTSGWIYKHWLDIFYPAKMPGREQLPFYASHFDTVEINYSFYRLPERPVFEKWRRQTPDGFLFAVKASSYLTHRKKLKEPEEPLQRLIDRAMGLEEKLGPILFQFQPNWRLNLERFEGFMAELGKYHKYRFAFEFRHKSWLVPEVYGLLEKRRAALALPVHPDMPLDVRLTAPWTYIRMHTGGRKGSFTNAQLNSWADRIGAWLDEGIDVYIYFNNDWEGYAIKDARRLRSLVEK